MGKISSLLTTALAVVSLASCSKESYTFRNSTPYGATYTAATKTAPVTETTEATAPEAAAKPELTASVAPVATKAAAKRAYMAPVSKKATAPAVAKAAPTKAEVKEAKAAVKAMHKAAKQAKAASPMAATGKSQLVAALLCFFLGGLSIHRFYLGYTGLAILQIVTCLLVFGFIWVLIDLVRILTGDLKPKGGEYEKTL
ncbi:TM2 domain-containing protein [Hymenobacter koreensis]|uniref:TM2 domain-containing protein n=1 Tax=Hymenobacter koreensis TaxID=1084523 RepID=A0ABP8IVB7_9BACT